MKLLASSAVLVLVIAAQSGFVRGQETQARGDQPAPARGDQPAPTQRGTRRGGPEGPFGPAELPGKGLAQHSFLYAGEGPKLNIFVVRDGKVDWSYTHPGRGEISDATMLSNGNILFAHQFGVTIVSPEKKVVWTHEAPTGTEIHTASPLGADRLMFVQNGDPAKLVVMKIADNSVEKEFNVPTGNARSTHVQFRHARPTKEGTFLVAHMDMNKVCEYDGAGKEIWTVSVPSPWAVARLKNGNTLITGNRNFVREVNPKGENVWELTQADLPGIRLFNTQTACRLANGNTLVTNWRDRRAGATLEQTPVQVIEVSPDKKVVWALRSWDEPAALGQASNIQILEEKGAAEKFELER